MYVCMRVISTDPTPTRTTRNCIQFNEETGPPQSFSPAVFNTSQCSGGSFGKNVNRCLLNIVSYRLIYSKHQAQVKINHKKNIIHLWKLGYGTDLLTIVTLLFSILALVTKFLLELDNDFLFSLLVKNSVSQFFTLF